MAHSSTGHPTAEADDVAQALSEIWELLTGAIPGAWCERRGGAIAAVTRAEVPNLNGVWVYSASTDPGTTDDLLDRVAGTGLPHCLQLRPGASHTLVARAERRGMVVSETVPLMVLEDHGALG